MDSYVPSVRRTPAEVKQLIDEVDLLVKDHMRQGIDYGTIPGTPKPSLYKAGAERLARFFGLGSTVELVEKTEDWDKGFFAYTYKVGVGPIDGGGVVRPVAWSIGHCNSRESKYVKPCANGKAADLVNTIMKMSQKRAFVGAVLLITNTSDRFSQDTEDMPREMFQEERQSQPKPASSGKDEDMVITFGKYGPKDGKPGKTLGAIAAENDTYLPWLKGQLQKKADEGKLPADQLPLKDAVERMCA
jgi:hypothetical protein